MKYVVIAGLLGIIFVLVYARIRPYLKLIQKVASSFEVTTSVAAEKKTASRNKLVRCDRCGTWVPAERALNLKSGLATFCSPECMTAEPASRERKIAG